MSVGVNFDHSECCAKERDLLINAAACVNLSILLYIFAAPLFAQSLRPVACCMPWSEERSQRDLGIQSSHGKHRFNRGFSENPKESKGFPYPGHHLMSYVGSFGVFCLGLWLSTFSEGQMSSVFG